SEKASRADTSIYEAIRAEKGEWSGPGLPDGTDLSRSRIQGLIKEGRATANGKAIKPSDRLASGTRVELSVPAPRPLKILPEASPIDILYEDSDLLVVNKPPGLTVHPSEHSSQGTLVNRLLHHVKDLSGIGGVERPGIVHRIDKDTSGALVITKTDRAHQGLSATFAKHAIEREYWALVYGVPKWKGEKTIEGTLGRNPKDRKKMAADVAGGRRAVTRVRCLERYQNFASWVSARLETGRTHQVRVHLTAEGHSLLGDPVYGAPTSRSTKWLALPEEIRAAVSALPGQALHARILGFDHPVTQRHIRVEAPLPPALDLLFQALERYSSSQ
ncbi:MAG TPA: RluA family pseudouridine synthase, partial [Bdellovibrionota bacterium]|nr:RluA family pseudouridine synthase [Bdellovibrionota bacterium]